MLKRIARSVFIQGQGSNYRRLTAEEKKTAEENFFSQLQASKPKMKRIRNFTSFFKELISDAKIPVPTQIPSEISIHTDTYSDNYAWMSDPKQSQELLSYISHELTYSESIQGSQWFLTKDLFDEFQRRQPEFKTQTVSKSGCKN